MRAVKFPAKRLIPLGMLLFGIILPTSRSTSNPVPDSVREQMFVTWEPPRFRSPVAKQNTGLGIVRQAARGIYSGPVPNGKEAFSSLAGMGVRTIVSVDGAEPDLALAKKYGLRYVHIPFGYAGVPEHARRDLVRVTRETEGPWYVHCHHGKHRGPAAAVIMCRSKYYWNEKQARLYLEQAGTGKQYPGLWEAARQSLPVSRLELVDGSLEDPLPELRSPSPLVSEMLALDEELNRLADQSLSFQGHAEASILIWETYRELARNSTHDEAFRAELLVGEQFALELVRAHEAKNVEVGPVLKKLRAHCTKCHQRFRVLNNFGTFRAPARLGGSRG